MAVSLWRSDYQALAWTVTEVDLHFVLDPQHTLLTSRLVLKRQAQVAQGPLVLLGDGLETQSVRLNGEIPSAMRQSETRLEIDVPGDEAILEVITRLVPLENTALSGLYASRGGLFTQCEAEGFRRMTWFPDRPDVMARYTVTLEADARQFPVLLSNGNLQAQGNLAGGRHFARWYDPFPKPSYLFALVAADLSVCEQRVNTSSGKSVLLQIWAEADALPCTAHAMASLVRAMRWDEASFGLELDLERFMVVAVADFNMGAMENKGLNIFNSKLLLASPERATDVDYRNIEAVVAHEYFHNWTGNRVTCRDWFQLTLKEGLTVFRDQLFTADCLAEAGGESARAVKRIDDVRALRAMQFPEDAGPMAHPIRPECYQEINNFYTATVYEKGAEVIRMLSTLLGREGFRLGMARYFERHDGQAVTCDDFVAAMADANQRDLKQFMRWYSRAGTPRVAVHVEYEVETARYRLRLKQSSGGEALLIPVALGLLDSQGHDIPLQLQGEASACGTTRLLEFSALEQEWVFVNVRSSAPDLEPAEPVLSLLRGFSAPVILEWDESEAALALRMAHDSDPFNRWDAAQRFMERRILAQATQWAETGAFDEDTASDAAFLAAFDRLLNAQDLDPACHAQILALPAESYLLERMHPADPLALRAAWMHRMRQLGAHFATSWHQHYRACQVPGPYRYHPQDAGRRALANLCLRYLCAAGDPQGIAAALAQARVAENMTDCLGGLTALVHSAAQERDAALAAFYQGYQQDSLVLDKWFALQAGAWSWQSGGEPVRERVRALLDHPAFMRTNPNKVYALLGTFLRANPGELHAGNGEGYTFWAEQVLALDRINPQVAARLARALERWRAFAPRYQEGMRSALSVVSRCADLSSDVREVLERALSA